MAAMVRTLGLLFPEILVPTDQNMQAAAAVRERLCFLVGDHRIEGKRDFIDLLEQGGFRYSIVKDAGHALNHEQPEAACREITAFLGS